MAALDPDDATAEFWPWKVWAQLRALKEGMVDDGGVVVRTGDPELPDTAFAQTLVQIDGDLVTKLRPTGSPGDTAVFTEHVDAVGRLLDVYAGLIRRILIWALGSIWALAVGVTGVISAIWGDWVALAGTVGSLLVALASRCPRWVQTAVGLTAATVTAIAAVAAKRWGPVVWMVVAVLLSVFFALIGRVLLGVVRRAIGKRLA